MAVVLAALLASIPAFSVTAHALPATRAFTGTWVLDPARSVLYRGAGAGGRELVVVDEPSTLHVTVLTPDSKHQYTVVADKYAVATDGKPHEERIPGEGVYVRTLRREGGELVFQITFTRSADKASISYTERWSLSEEGRTLTVYTAYPGGRDVMKVFARKD